LLLILAASAKMPLADLGKIQNKKIPAAENLSGRSQDGISFVCIRQSPLFLFAGNINEDR
jgi:hypothetical protein